MKRFAALALVAAAAGTVGVTTVTARGATGCVATSETRNTWHHVETPDAGAHLAMDDNDPCLAYAAADDGRFWVTRDGGNSWTRRASVGAPVRSLVRAGLPNDIVVAIPSGGGLRLTRDAGKTWASAGGLDTVTVGSIAVDPEDRTSLWATGTHSTSTGQVPTGSVFSSHDAGASWSESAGGVVLHPGAVARLGAPYAAVFAADARTKQLWRRSDADAFAPVYSADVRSLAVSPLKGGGSQLYAAGPSGIAVTRDGGSTFNLLTATAATAVAPEYQHFTAFLFVADGVVRRSTNAGRTSFSVNSGLPAQCRPVSLTADRGNPSTFLVTCADGGVWRWRSDGSDLSDTDVTQGAPGLISVLPRTTPMDELSRLRLPGGPDQSAAIAFDGSYLYYTRHGDTERVHRIVAATGKRAPDVVFPGLGAAIVAIMYDSKRDELYLADARARTWSVTLRTKRLRHLFDGPFNPSCCGDQPWGSMTFDASVDEFVFVNDSDNSIHWYDRATGRALRSCTASSVQLGPDGEDSDTGFAAVVATGDGDVYAGAEDDTTIYRLDSACDVTAAYTHAYLDEATDENDAMACDTVTFQQPAIWMRDASTATAYAYAVPDGYCALATRLSVTAPSTVSTGSPGTVCARLQRTGTGAPIAGQSVQLFVADRPIGTPDTDSTGRGCASYRPTAAEAGRGGTASTAVTTRSRLPVVGSFLGTIAYRPASAHARLVAIDPATPPGPPAQPPAAEHLGAPVAGAAPPAALAPPPPPAPPAAQVQPLPQAHPGAQPGAQAMGQPGAAAQNQQEVEAATAQVQRDEFRARPSPQAPVDLRVVLPAGVMLAAVVARRRRASRVRAQRS